MKYKKAQAESTVGKWILRLILLGVILFIIARFIVMPLASFLSIDDKEESVQSVFFSTEYVGTYYNNKFGETPQNCTKTNNNYDCKTGTNIEFYVGILNKGEKKRYFYPTPCIIKDYTKGDKCENSNYLTSFRPCGIEAAQKGECVVGRGFILETGKYRIYPGAKCLPDDCYDPENPTTNEVKVNYGSFFEITVK